MVALLVPKSLDELRNLVGSGPLISGGTDLLVQMRDGREATRLVDLSNLTDAPPPVRTRDGFLEISALSPISDVVRDLDGALPGIAASARLFGSLQIRNRATIGGNLANASPAGDMIPPLVAAEAVLVLESSDGAREVAVSDFVTGPGKTVLADDEWISLVRIPLPRGDEGFLKLGGRSAMAISVVTLAWRWTRQSDGSLADVRLALGAVAPTVIRASEAESLLEAGSPVGNVLDEVVAAVSGSISPIDDVRASAWYRRAVAGDLLREALAA